MGVGHRTGVLWGGLTPLRGVLIRPQRIPTTCKVGVSEPVPIQGGWLVGVVGEVLKPRSSSTSVAYTVGVGELLPEPNPAV